MFSLGGLSAMGLGACGSGNETPASGAPFADRRLLIRRKLARDPTPRLADSNASVVLSQVRGGIPRGDAVFAVRDESEKSELLKVQTYISDGGGYHSGRWIAISQKRYDFSTPEWAGRIQGVSAVSESSGSGSEPSMICASTDIDGPAIAAEAWTSSEPGSRNASAFAAYDLNDVHGGVTSHSPGFGRKKFVIRGDGGLWWGSDLRDEPFARSDIRLERAAPGHLRLTSPKKSSDAVLEVSANDGEAALRLASGAGKSAELRTGAEGWDFRFGRERAGECGVDPNAAFRDFIRTDGHGPPTAGRWTVGACVLNGADRTVWWCIEAGRPGRWAGLRLEPE